MKQRQLPADEMRQALGFLQTGMPQTEVAQ